MHIQSITLFRSGEIMKKLIFLMLFALSARAAEKNIIFFITDDESLTLGCYGDPVAVTPAVDTLEP